VELDEAIRGRRMCRDFLARPLPDGLVDRLLDRARRAPSAGNTQGWSFLVLEGAADTGRFWATDADPAWLAAPDHPGLLNAAALVLPWCRREAYEERYRRPDKAGAGAGAGAGSGADGGDPGGPGGPAGWSAPYWYIDTAFAVMLLLLAAEQEGIGALLFRIHCRPEALRAAFGVPAGWEPLGAVALGWPAGTGPAERSPEAGAHRPPPRPLREIVHRGRWQPA
jgi:nitroreductase